MAQASTVNPLATPIPPRDSAPGAAVSRAAFTCAMLSDVGRIRQSNEDACGANEQHAAFVVCDGMGGAAAGEVASTLARDTFLQTLAASAAAPRARLAEAVRAANQAVHKQAQRSRAHRGMGTTLVAALLVPAAEPEAAPALWLAHVGDSRCYRLRGGRLELLTRDHSLIEEQIQAGLLTPAEAATSPIRNIITRAIGTYPAVEPEIAAQDTAPGDLILLASDGLTRELDEDGVAAILRATAARCRPGEPPAQSLLDETCRRLVDAANAHGGGDNITVLLLALP